MPVLRDRDGYLRGYLQYMSFDIPLFFRLVFARRSDGVVAEPPPTTGVVVRITSWIRRTPYVYYAADIWSDAAKSTGAPKLVVSIVRVLEVWSLRGANHVVAVTSGVADKVRVLAKHDRISVVRNGVDIGIFKDHVAADRCKPVAVYTGTTSEWQGAEVFIDAMPAVLAVIPDARMVFLGHGRAWDDLRDRAQLAAPKAIEFRPVASPEDAASLLREAKVALVSLRPGLGYDFAIPTKIFAATACGTPVLFAGDGAAAMLVTENTLGCRVEWDSEQVSTQLIAMLTAPSDPARRRDLSQWAVQNASIQATAAKVAEIIVASSS
jgi:glycosyltransferase involved in cell wall biosynthesis